MSIGVVKFYLNDFLYFYQYRVQVDLCPNDVLTIKLESSGPNPLFLGSPSSRLAVGALKISFSTKFLFSKIRSGINLAVSLFFV